MRKLIVSVTYILIFFFNFFIFSEQEHTIATIFTEGNETKEQVNKFNTTTNVIYCEVPAHGNYSASKFVVSDEAGVLIETEGTCLINSKPKFNAKVGGLLGNLFSSQTKEEKKYFVLNKRIERVGQAKKAEMLHPVHQSTCNDEPVVITEDARLNETEYDKFMAGGFVTIAGGNPNQRSCDVQAQVKHNISSKHYGFPRCVQHVMVVARTHADVVGPIQIQMHLWMVSLFIRSSGLEFVSIRCSTGHCSSSLSAVLHCKR